MYKTMKTISYKKCLDSMFALGRFGIKLGLDTVDGILKNLDYPQKKFRSIHIAGTNGKGSTASYIASILQNSGCNVALYTSPHLIKFNERFVINGKQVSDNDIVDAYLAVKNADTGERQATFFELATSMAFYLFAGQKVKWAVIETGMGGRLDATNIILPELSIISNLSIEHADYLGDSLEAIAGEKAGIIKHQKPVITGVSQPSALKIIKDRAEKMSAPLYIKDHDFFTENAGDRPLRFNYRGILHNWKGLETSLKGPHQTENAALALAACDLLSDKILADSGKSMITETSVRTGLATTKWPGRLEYIMKSPDVIIDGAHNLHAAENLGMYLDENFNQKHLTMVIGILNDKPYKEMLTNLLPCADKIIFTRAKIDRSLDPAVLRDFAQTFSSAHIQIIEDVAGAVEHAVKSASSDDAVCIAGSLYVAGEARDKIMKNFIN